MFGGGALGGKSAVRGRGDGRGAGRRVAVVGAGGASVIGRGAPVRDACAQEPPWQRQDGLGVCPGEGGKMESAGQGRGGGGRS